MIYHAQQGFRGKVVDLDTGRVVPKVIWFDDVRGELEAYQVGSDGKVLRHEIDGDYLTYKVRGRFEWLPEVAKCTTKIVMGAPQCARCNSLLTLPGDDLCPVCRAKDRGQRNKMVVERLTVPLLDVQCEECSRQAEWSVGDEVEVTPQLRKRWLYVRGQTVGRRYYCSFHFQPPRLLDAKGEVIEDLGDERLRPQYG